MFQGDRVVNQNFEVALFQDLGSSPATLDASRACDAVGCAPGNTTEIADAPAAYLQADLKGSPCWVHLPEEAWPSEPALRKKFEDIVAAGGKPVVRLQKALYGHTLTVVHFGSNTAMRMCAASASSRWVPNGPRAIRTRLLSSS